MARKGMLKRSVETYGVLRYSDQGSTTRQVGSALVRGSLIPFVNSGEQKQPIINHGISRHLDLDSMISQVFNWYVAYHYTQKSSKDWGTDHQGSSGRRRRSGIISLWDKKQYCQDILRRPADYTVWYRMKTLISLFESSWALPVDIKTVSILSFWHRQIAEFVKLIHFEMLRCWRCWMKLLEMTRFELKAWKRVPRRPSLKM